ASDRILWREAVQRLGDETNDVERKLVKLSPALANEKQLADIRGTDVTRRLGADEAAVEFIRFPFHDGKKATGTSYLALVVRTPLPTEAIRRFIRPTNRQHNDQGHDIRTSFHITPEGRQPPPRHLQGRGLAKRGPYPSSSVLHHPDLKKPRLLAA